MKASLNWCFQSVFQVFVFLQCLVPIQSTYIPATGISKSGPAALFKRAVTYGDTGNSVAASAICSDDQKKVLETSMLEVVKLAVAGSDAFDLILDMLTDEKVKYRALDLKDRVRIRYTYFTFFGKIRSTIDFPWHQEHIKWIKTRLDRLRDLSVESWPQDIKFFCDSSYYQDKDNQGRTKDEVSPPKDKTPARKMEWKYDWDQQIWAEAYLASDCHKDGGTVAAYTLRFPDVKKDRITFCPQWFEVTKAAGKSFTDLDREKDIVEGDNLSMFARRSGRILLHEHLHTFFVNQADGKDDVLADVEGAKSYSATSAARYGLQDREKAVKNIENVVYWCISMFYDNWDWTSLAAKAKSDQPPP